jgi:hypothetical protein
MAWTREEQAGDLREAGWQRNLLGPPHFSVSPRMRQQAHHPQASQTPDGSERKNMGFLEGAEAIWNPSPNSSLTLGSHPLVMHSNRVQQGAEGCRLSAPELAPPAGGGCHTSHPLGCLVLTQPPPQQTIPHGDS